jgi:hypothetical protein
VRQTTLPCLVPAPSSVTWGRAGACWKLSEPTSLLMSPKLCRCVSRLGSRRLTSQPSRRRRPTSVPCSRQHRPRRGSRSLSPLQAALAALPGRLRQARPLKPRRPPWRLHRVKARSRRRARALTQPTSSSTGAAERRATSTEPRLMSLFAASSVRTASASKERASIRAKDSEPC